MTSRQHVDAEPSPPAICFYLNNLLDNIIFRRLPQEIQLEKGAQTIVESRVSCGGMNNALTLTDNGKYSI